MKWTYLFTTWYYQYTNKVFENPHNIVQRASEETEISNRSENTKRNAEQHRCIHASL